MKPFTYTRATDQREVIQLLMNQSQAKLIAGGTNIIDLMREQVEQPDQLIDITHLPLAQVEALANGSMRLGALARNSAVANDERIREHYPLLAQAILHGASPQLRNMATVGGNLMQRTRCYYFYDSAAACNKRAPGAGCDALGGYNHIHAILGASEQCIAVHPSDMCVALAALDAVVHVEGPQGARSIPFAEFHRLPGDTPALDTNLQHDELIIAVDLSVEAAVFAEHAHYLKVRDRASYAFALVSVAAALDLADGTIRQARVALGGVAHKPWRTSEAEQILKGAQPGEQVFRAAAEAALQDAHAYEHNRYKIELGKRTIVQALLAAARERGATA